MDVNRRAFVTADTHFGHLDAIEKFDRPFGDLSTMDDALLAGINEVVGEDDLLYHLGDFVGPTPKGVSRTDHARAMRARINCRNIVLVRGNHDPRRNPEFDALFESVHDLLSFRGWHRDDGSKVEDRVVMSHYSIRVWQGRLDGSLHLYGHSHGTLPEVGRSTDVGVDCWGYRPRPLAELLESLSGRAVGMDLARGRVQPVR